MGEKTLEKIPAYSLATVEMNGPLVRLEKGKSIRIIEGVVKKIEGETVILELPTQVYLNGVFFKQISKDINFSKQEFKEMPKEGKIVWILYTGDFTGVVKTMRIIKASPELREEWIKKNKQPPMLNMSLSADPKLCSLIDAIINAEIISVPTRR
jgi:hypothetical protein